MSLPIIEQPLYTRIALETLNQLSGSWVNRTEYLTTLDYTEGGRPAMPGTNTVEVGSLNASFSNLPSIPIVGDFVRLRRAGTSEYAFTGFVRDVGQRIVFDNSVSLTTPITITTIYCVDWVAFATQWTVNGVGGRNGSFALFTTGSYTEAERIRALNYSLDTTNATQLITPTAESGSTSLKLNDTDVTATMAEHMDLMSRSTGMVWYGTHVIPTNNTTGRDNLIKWQGSNGVVSSGKTFTDLAGSAGQLHYTEIDFESSSMNIANVVTLQNKCLIRFPDADISRIGGANENNFIYVDLSTKQIGIAPDNEWRYDDTSSQATYGARFTELETNVNTPIASSLISSVDYYLVNLIANPSVEYTDDGWSSSSVNRARRREPSTDASPFAAYNGRWAIRVRQRTADTTSTVTYSGGETDGIAVTVGRYYRFFANVAKGTPARIDVRALIQISWYDADEALLSRSSGSNVTLTTNTWSQIEHVALAPANANRAIIGVVFSRVGAGNIFVGDLMWVDGLMMHRSTFAGTPGIGYVDGDSARGTGGINVWSGEVGNSQSLVLDNQLLTRATEIATQYSTTSVRATRIRWNAQEDLSSVSALSVGKQITLIYKGTTTTYRIAGIDGTVDPERYMIDYYLVKV